MACLFVSFSLPARVVILSCFLHVNALDVHESWKHT